jgi:hypothetical protein
MVKETILEEEEEEEEETEEEDDASTKSLADVTSNILDSIPRPWSRVKRMPPVLIVRSENPVRCELNCSH